MTSKLLFLLLGIIPCLSYSQTNGKMILQVTPKNASIEIENKLYQLGNKTWPMEIELPAGSYKIKIWAPTRKLIEDTIVIEADSTLYYRKNLNTLSEEYKTYNDKLAYYHKQKLLKIGLIGLDIGVTAATTAFIFAKKDRADNDKNIVDINSKAYQTSVNPENIKLAKSEYFDSVERYKKSNSTYKSVAIGGLAVITIINGLTILKIIKDSKNPLTKPIFDEKNPLSKTTFKIRNNGYSNPNFQFQITYSF
ncbi:MAG TPA: hypothetical protein ENJ95_05805 [Bacteroidetes bacterium]|nr:hypothetical protein [Bacteroidota bacterium]